MWLRILTGPDAGKAVRVEGPRFVVGRRRGADLILRDPTVAPRHAVFHVVGDRCRLEDLETEHGTFVAGVRIRDTVELHGREQICFGETFVTLYPAAATPRSRRRRLAIGAAVAAVIAAAGATAGVLAPRTGGGPGEATVAAPRAAPPPAPLSPPVEPAAGTVPAETATETAPADTEPVPAPEPIRVEDDFSDPGSGWEVFGEPAVAATYEGGAFVMRITDSTWYATATLERAFAGAVVEVDVQNPGLNPRAGFGIVCHHRSDRRFHVLAVGTDGTYAILRQSGERLTVLSGDGAWASSPSVPVAAPRYALRAECLDGSLALFVNGDPVASVTTRAAGGRVGFFAAGQAEFRFDDVVIEGTPA